MKINNIASLVFVIITILFSSCDADRIYENNIKIDKEGWPIHKTYRFSAEISDTILANNIYINVRNSGNYDWSNLYLFIKTTAPNGATIKDTVSLRLADDKGKWLGNGFGSIFDNQIPYKMNVGFPNKGIYVFELQHGMRTKNLENILDIGIRIEKTSIK